MANNELSKLRILVTNDDGINSTGIKALEQLVRQGAEFDFDRYLKDNADAVRRVVEGILDMGFEADVIGRTGEPPRASEDG